MSVLQAVAALGLAVSQVQVIGGQSSWFVLAKAVLDVGLSIHAEVLRRRAAEDEADGPPRV